MILSEGISPRRTGHFYSYDELETVCLTVRLDGVCVCVGGSSQVSVLSLNLLVFRTSTSIKYFSHMRRKHMRTPCFRMLEKSQHSEAFLWRLFVQRCTQ